MGEEEKVVNVGWVSLSNSGNSLTIRVLDQLFFVPLRDLDSVLKGHRDRTEAKQCNGLSKGKKNGQRKSDSIYLHVIRTPKLCNQKETEVLKYNLCTVCPKSCEYDVELVVLFPHDS